MLCLCPTVSARTHELRMFVSNLTDDEVCDGEGEQEVVGDGLQLLVHLEADHHLLSRK